MNFYFLLYSFSITSSILGGISLFRHYRNTSGLFFLLFTIFASFWFIFFYLFFNSTESSILIIYSKFDFLVSIIALYCFLLFIYYFQPSKGPIKKDAVIKWGIVSILLLYLYVGTPYILSGLQQDEYGIFRETPGILYPLHVFLSLMSLPVIGYFAKKKLLLQSDISKIRLTRIIFSGCLLILTLLLLQLILPMFGIWILEKKIIITFTFFVLYVAYTVRRYYFSPLHQEYGFINIGVMLLTFFMSIIILNATKYFYLGTTTHINSFWNVSDKLNMIDSSIVIIAYVIFYNFFKKLFLINDSDQKIKQDIDSLKQSISDTTTIELLNRILQGGIRKIFKTNYSKVILFENKDEGSEFKKYFSHSLGEKVFINDVLFIEENKRKFDKKLILKEIDRDAVLVFPILNTEGKIFGLYFIGKKLFGDFYTVNEIKILFNLVKFIGLHLKYLSTYIKIQDYSLQLDQRIDDKTIEYNDLINKQKEFISMISHEIRSPIGSAIFQIDSLVDDMDQSKITLIDIKKNVKNIGDQLIHIGELLKKLFSIQYFDTRTVILLKEKIHIGILLEKEFEIYSRMYEDITFIKKISPHLGFVNIDKIHFQQVLTNLLENAIKFANTMDPVILIECSNKDGETFRINIEDNGLGYGDIDPSTIFEKYTKGNHAKLGLGMGLYLCNRIITMHDGTITAGHGKILNGASFVIELPI